MNWLMIRVDEGLPGHLIPLRLVSASGEFHGNAAYFAAMPGSLEVTTLLLYEFRQAVRFQIRLHRHDPSKGYPRAEGNKMLADLKSDLIGKRIRSTTRATLEVDAASARRHGFVHEKPFVFIGAYRGASLAGSR